MTTAVTWERNLATVQCWAIISVLTPWHHHYKFDPLHNLYGRINHGGTLHDPVLDHILASQPLPGNLVPCNLYGTIIHEGTLHDPILDCWHLDPWHHPPGNLVEALNYYGTSIPSSLLLPSKENPAQSLFLWCINIYERIYHNVPWMVKWTAKFKETSAVI